MPDDMTRAEHLAWCRQRALEFLNAGDLPLANASMSSDLMKHSETRPTEAQLSEGLRLAIARDADGMRDWIEDFR